MVCQRQHHLGCVGQAVFICAACQKRTLEKCVAGPGSGNTIFQQLAIGSGVVPSGSGGGSGSGGTSVSGTPASGAGMGVGRTYSSTRRQSALPPIVQTY